MPSSLAFSDGSIKLPVYIETIIRTSILLCENSADSVLSFALAFRREP